MKKLAAGIAKTAAAATRDFFRRQGVNQSAALAFYSLLSFIPMIFLMISIYGLAVGDTWEAQLFVRRELDALIPFADDLLFKRAQRLIWATPNLGWQSLVFIVWSSALFFNLLRRNLLHPWRSDVEPARGLGRLLPWLAGPVIGCALLALVTLVQFLGFMPYKLVPKAERAEWYWLFLVWGLFCFGLLFFGIYEAILPRKRPVRLILGVSFCLAGAGYGVTWLFSQLLMGLPRYNLVYGSLAGVALFLLWLNYNVALILWGGHFIRVWTREHGPARPWRIRVLPKRRRRSDGEEEGEGLRRPRG